MNTYSAIIGPPGCGKSYTLNQLINEDPSYAIVTSTTGISALNVGGCTINSLLQYFDAADLYQKIYKDSNYLLSKFKQISKEFKGIALDEISMMDGISFTIIVGQLNLFNKTNDRKLNLLCLGDPGQLPVVSKTNKTPAFFEVPAWNLFEIEYRNKIYRQDNQEFIDALSKIRLGKAKEVIDWFIENVEFSNYIDDKFNGSTFFSTNKKVDQYNYKKLKELKGEEYTYEAIREGPQSLEWKSIPDKTILKKKALVVLLNNNKDQGYVNGDLAYVKECTPNFVLVELLRNKQEKVVSFTTRKNSVIRKGKTGKVSYLPLRLGSALTVHRTQGLTINRAQIYLKENFLSRLSGGLAVALSRVTTPEGLRLVGNKDDFVKACYIEPKYIEFINQLERRNVR